MNVLIRKATIIDKNSSYNGQKVDLLIENGQISKIGVEINAKAQKVIEGEQLCLSIGWMDIGAQIGDPGFEHREDLHSATIAAAAGGYTSIACYPNSNPVVDSKSGILYIKQNTSQSLVDFYPIGAISENCNGKDITEMIDMHRAGAVAFSDGKYPIQDNGLMMRALLYIKSFNGVIINQPQDKTIAHDGQANEGIVSTSLGIRGIPHMAEEIMLQRDIFLAEYTQSKLHVANISTANAVEMIRKAKQNGLQITASVAAMNLAYADTAIHGFDSNYKVLPPLRTQKDIAALKDGLKDGTIDIINSNHIPLEEEAKKLEFTYADFGVIGLETSFAVANMNLSGCLSLEQLIEKLAIVPRQLLGIDIPAIEEGKVANLTIFDPKQNWVYEEKNIKSKSKNSPFIGQKLKGKVLGVINNKQIQFFE
jgi:dihydroorotase